MSPFSHTAHAAVRRSRYVGGVGLRLLQLAVGADGTPRVVHSSPRLPSSSPSRCAAWSAARRSRPSGGEGLSLLRVAEAAAGAAQGLDRR